VAVTEAEALQRLRQILALPEFQSPPRPFWERLFLDARDWLADQLTALLQGVPDAVLGRLGWLQGIAVLAALAGAVVIVVFVVRAVGLSVSGEARQRAATMTQLRARSDQLWRDGQALAQAGQLGAACRTLYLSALYALEEHGLVRVEQGQTNREHADRAVKAQPELVDTFDRLVQRYDRLRYGDYVVDRGAFDEISALVGRTRASRVATR
jgi:hypothetical protein